MPPRFRLFFVLILLASCAHSASWRNPNLPPAQEKADESACRRSAEEDLSPQTAYTSPGSEKSDSPMQMVDRSERRQRFKELVADCMERKGYRRGN